MEGVQRSAYFVKKPTTFKQSIRYYDVVSMGKGFFDHFEKAWARLSKDFSFDLVLHGAKGDETWAARILEYPEGSQCLDELKSRSHAIWPKSVNVVAVFLIGKSPLFVDCRNSFCQVDPVTHSKRSWDQIKAAFDFLADFIEI
ncbi:hypothetical protein NXS19_013782 [Fusarium pseudograminearum]|nr:hypothetical protein NXS19_013782 [Fusarium pseudograminearum]